jgi:replicative superfamily II helicase
MLRDSVTATGEYDAAGRGGQRKAIYLAPTKALLHEKIRLWKESFANPLGLVFKVRARRLNSTANSVA